MCVEIERWNIDFSKVADERSEPDKFLWLDVYHGLAGFELAMI